MPVRVQMMALKIVKSMCRPVAVMRPACLLICIYIIENKTGAANQVTGVCVINCPIIFKMMKKAALGIAHIRLIKGKYRLDMAGQEIFAFKVGISHFKYAFTGAIYVGFE